MKIRRHLLIQPLLIWGYVMLMNCAVAVIMMFLIRNNIEVQFGRGFAESDKFAAIASDLQKYSIRWTENPQQDRIIADMNTIGEKLDTNWLTFSLFRGREEIHTIGTPIPQSMTDMALENRDHRFFSIDSAAAYTLSAGDFLLILMDSGYYYGHLPRNIFYWEYLFKRYIVLLVCMTLGLLSLPCIPDGSAQNAC
ncbi:hypothetical protein K7I13_10275 [Brucepastera parasyntrophica]|uniref:hypothetical protein n=1 Tax=Brucepastera parasyntrophica TaxID=2880008 RepID=UPI00210DEDEB|nr:hypothetical protein [Brucepastera parasyntrophica]ULQ58908.1 hypothetical protein K7I13_10275 [Brucepastera parasyntrophica]